MSNQLIVKQQGSIQLYQTKIVLQAVLTKYPFSIYINQDSSLLLNYGLVIGQNIKTVFIKKGDDCVAELKVSLHIIKDGEIHEIEKVSNEDMEIMSERLGSVMSEYFTQHPKEFVKLESVN